MVAVNIHGIERRSRANGPGSRFVMWFQGCSLGCPGCFNPGTHAPTSQDRRPVDVLVDEILAQGQAIEGITLSGGEPFEQPDAALALVSAVRARSELSILIFSGYTIEEIRAMPQGPAVLAHVDVLVDGRYQARQRLGRGLRGSANQRIHLLSERYGVADVEATPEAEIRIDAQGRVVLTGVDPLRLKRTREP
jgi:anaerobic ribonucleoside-triphosphate reductase activating protein